MASCRYLLCRQTDSILSIQHRRFSVVVTARSLGQIEMHDNALDTLSNLNPGWQRTSASPCCVHSIRPVGYFRLGPLRYSCSRRARSAADEWGRSCARSSLAFTLAFLFFCVHGTLNRRFACLESLWCLVTIDVQSFQGMTYLLTYP